MSVMQALCQHPWYPDFRCPAETWHRFRSPDARTSTRWGWVRDPRSPPTLRGLLRGVEGVTSPLDSLW